MYWLAASSSSLSPDWLLLLSVAPPRLFKKSSLDQSPKLGWGCCCDRRSNDWLLLLLLMTLLDGEKEGRRHFLLWLPFCWVVVEKPWTSEAVVVAAAAKMISSRGVVVDLIVVSGCVCVL